MTALAFWPRTRGCARVFLPSVLGTGEDLAPPSVQVFRFGDLDEADLHGGVGNSNGFHKKFAMDDKEGKLLWR